MSDTPSQTPNAPPLTAFLAYLMLGLVVLLLPEYSLSDDQVIRGFHLTDDFIPQTVFLLAIWTAIAIWWLGDYRCLRSPIGESPPKEWASQVVVGVLLMGVLAAWCKPFLSSDTFYYVAYGRQLAVLGINPYEHNLYVSVSDPIIGQIPKMWFHNVAFYGPLALSLYSLPNVLLPQPSLMTLAVFLKFLWLPFYAALGWLAMRYWSDRTDRLARTATVMASPVLLWYGLVDGHVDILIVLFLLLTAYLLKQDKAELSALSLAAAASIKIIGIVALPVCFFWWLHRSVRKAVAFSGVFVVTYGGLYAAVKGGEYPGVVEFTALWDNLGAANLIPRLLSLSSLELSRVQTISNLIFYGTVVVVSALTWRGYFSRNPVLPMGWVIAALFLTRTYFQPWYSLWFWPLLWFSPRSSNGFYRQFYLWNLTALLAWLFPWDLKGYFVGILSLAALVLATRENESTTADFPEDQGSGNSHRNRP